MAKRGPKSTLDARTKTILVNLAKEKKTIEQMASIIDVNPATIYRWLVADAKLCEAIKEGRNFADETIEASLYQRAHGYSVEAVKIFFDAKSGETIEHKYIQHYPPDPTSMIFWLKNRQPEKWRDKQEFDLTKDIIVNFDNNDKNVL